MDVYTNTVNMPRPLNQLFMYSIAVVADRIKRDNSCECFKGGKKYNQKVVWIYTNSPQTARWAESDSTEGHVFCLL